MFCRKYLNVTLQATAQRSQQSGCVTHHHTTPIYPTQSRGSRHSLRWDAQPCTPPLSPDQTAFPHAKPSTSTCLKGCTELAPKNPKTASLWVQQRCALHYSTESSQRKNANTTVSCWIFISMLCNCISINNHVQYITIMTSIRSFSEKIRLQTLYCTDPNNFFFYFLNFFCKLRNLLQEVYKRTHQIYNHIKTDQEEHRQEDL